MKVDESSALGRERCLALLTSVPIGRIVYTDRALPAVMPVRFVVDGDGVTLLTGSDSTMAAAVRNAVVAFQADDVDPVSLTGWSVTLIGHAVLLDQRDIERPAGPRAGSRYVHIPAQQISGSRFGPDGYEPAAPPTRAEGPGELRTSGR